MEDNKYHMGEVMRTLERIENQVLKTNGRVSALEKWRWIISGALVAIGVLSIPNLSTIAKILSGV